MLNEGFLKIGRTAFDDCTLLTIIELPSTATEIGLGAFCGCTNLREVVLNEGVQKIGYEAFTACESLNVILSVTEVGSYTFARCINLK